MSTKQYATRFLPLESDPEIFTSLIRELGAPPSLIVNDVVDIDTPDDSAVAAILAFRTLETYISHDAREGFDENVIWLEQTIDNACGLYAVLHAVLNGLDKNSIGGH